MAPSLTSSLCTPSDHFPIFTRLSVVPTPLPPPTSHSFRRLHSIDIDLFLSDIQSSSLIIGPPASLGSLLSSYNKTLSTLLDKHAPVITRFSKRSTKSNPWFSSTLHAFRSTVRRAENLYKRTHSALSFLSVEHDQHAAVVAIESKTIHTFVACFTRGKPSVIQCSHFLLTSAQCYSR